MGSVRGPIIERDRTVTLPTTGALDLGYLAPTSIGVYRALTDTGWPVRFGIGVAGAVDRRPTTVIHHVHLRELDVSAASTGLGPVRDDVVLANAAGRRVSCSARVNTPDAVVPPFAEASLAVTSDADFSAVIGGPGLSPWVAIWRAPTSPNARETIWSITGTLDVILDLASLPRLPSGRPLASLALTGLRGARITAGAGHAPDPVAPGVARDEVCGITLEPIDIAP